MKIAVRVVAGIIAFMGTVDIVYLFGLVVGEIHSSYEHKQRKKYAKEK